MAAIALIRLLPAVHPLVPVQVVTLDEPHITGITCKWLFPLKKQRQQMGTVYQHLSAAPFHLHITNNT